MLEVKGDYNKLTEEMGEKMVETAVSQVSTVKCKMQELPKKQY